MKTNETTCDIIAEMNSGPIPEHRHDREILRYYAYRFEEAHRRERGDCAKLREALDRLAITSETFLRTNSGQSYEDTIDALDKARAALAAPPRNCDRPECATTKVAADVWRKEDGGKTAYYEWLLALAATEKEGGAK